MIPVEHFLILGSVLFATGLIIVMVKKSAIVILIGIELMLNASNINLVAFSRLDEKFMTGQVFALFCDRAGCRGSSSCPRNYYQCLQEFLNKRNR